LIQSSQGLGWTDLFVAVTDEAPHEGIHGAIPAVWLATAATPNNIERIGSLFNRKEILPRQSISITRSGEAAYDELSFPLRARHMYLRQSFLDELANDIFKDGRERRFVESSFGFSDPILYRLMAAIRYSLNEPSFGNRLKIDYLTLALGAHLLTKHSTIIPPPRPLVHTFNSRQIGNLSDYINDNISQDLSILELSRIVGLNRAQFSRRFKVTTSMTPHHFVTLRRISQARKLLQSPVVDYALIALACGFADQSHFTATFKRVCGITPHEYRKLVA
jgi:AraC-like DNA-binding protein